MSYLRKAISGSKASNDFSIATESQELNRIMTKLDALGALAKSVRNNTSNISSVAMEAAITTNNPKYIKIANTDSCIALEEINGGMIALIIAGVVAIGVLIKKFINWMFGGSSGGSGGGGSSSYYSDESVKIDNLRNKMHQDQAAFLKGLKKQQDQVIGSIKNGDRLEKELKDAVSGLDDKLKTVGAGIVLDGEFKVVTEATLKAEKALSNNHDLSFEAFIKDHEDGKLLAIRFKNAVSILDEGTKNLDKRNTSNKEEKKEQEKISKQVTDTLKMTIEASNKIIEFSKNNGDISSDDITNRINPLLKAQNDLSDAIQAGLDNIINLKEEMDSADFDIDTNGHANNSDYLKTTEKYSNDLTLSKAIKDFCTECSVAVSKEKHEYLTIQDDVEKLEKTVNNFKVKYNAFGAIKEYNELISVLSNIIKALQKNISMLLKIIATGEILNKLLLLNLNKALSIVASVRKEYQNWVLGKGRKDNK